MHPRQAIRAKIVALIKGKTIAGNSVYASQIRPVGQDELPRIHVYANKENIGVYQESPREYERTLTISVEIQAKADENLDNTLDGLAEQVEKLLHQDHTLGELCRDVVLTDAELNITAEGETLIGACILTYVVTYYTYAVADMTEENEFNDLKKMNIKWDQPDHPPGEIDAEDEINFT